MADTKISALTAATFALAGHELAVNESGTSKKVTVAQLRDFFAVGNLYAPGSFALVDGRFARMTKTLILTGTQRATIAGTARLRID